MAKRWKWKCCCKGENWRAQAAIVAMVKEDSPFQSWAAFVWCECGVCPYLSGRCQKLPLQSWRSVVQAYRLSMGSVKIAEAVVVRISSARN